MSNFFKPHLSLTFGLFLGLFCNLSVAQAHTVPRPMMQILIRSATGFDFLHQLAERSGSSMGIRNLTPLLQAPEMRPAVELIEGEMSRALIQLIQEGKIARPPARMRGRRAPDSLLSRFFAQNPNGQDLIQMAERLDHQNSRLLEIFEYLPIRAHDDFIRPSRTYYSRDPMDLPN